MTDKLGREELLEWLKDLYSAANTYGWGDDKDNQAYKQIKMLIQKSGVTEEWIEEKTKELFQESKEGSFSIKSFCNFFIRKIVEEMPAKTATVSEKDVEGWSQEARVRVMAQGDWRYVEDVMKQMLTEAGVEIRK